MTPFRFEHVFRAPSVASVFAAYFDPTCQAAQDQAIDITERTIIEHHDTGAEVRRVCRVVPRRQLPGIVRSLIPGQLHYVETARWSRAEDRLDLEIRPSLLGGRAVISGRYTLAPAGAGQVRRTYEGEVTVEVAMLGGRIERALLAEMERSMPRTAACTQEWLERQTTAGT